MAQLNNIKDVAGDLGRELIRMQIVPDNAIHAMVAYIKAEAEAALIFLQRPR
jgi:hypothetical protein